MFKLKKIIGVIGILLILFFSISGCSNKNDNYCKCANCENFISSNNNSANDTNNIEESNKNTKDNTIDNENLSNNSAEENTTNTELSNSNISTSNIITQENAVDIVKNSNKLKNIKENLRGGEHEVFFRSYAEEVQEMKGYAVHPLIYNPARNGEEKIGNFFVSEIGELYFYDPGQGLLYFPVD